MSQENDYTRHFSPYIEPALSSCTAATTFWSWSFLRQYRCNLGWRKFLFGCCYIWDSVF